MICETITITNKLGLHARASAKFVTLASGFGSNITLSRNGQKINGKSIMGIMMLAAGRGIELKLCVDGDDEKQAMDALRSLINERFGESE